MSDDTAADSADPRKGLPPQRSTRAPAEGAREDAERYDRPAADRDAPAQPPARSPREPAEGAPRQPGKA